MEQKKAIAIVIVFVVAIFIFSIGGNLLINVVADRVIEKIRQDYSPSRYGPGIDPDKLEIDPKMQKKQPWNN